jgi:hypothetical protein
MQNLLSAIPPVERLVTFWTQMLVGTDPGFIGPQFNFSSDDHAVVRYDEASNYLRQATILL